MLKRSTFSKAIAALLVSSMLLTGCGGTAATTGSAIAASEAAAASAASANGADGAEAADTGAVETASSADSAGASSAGSSVSGADGSASSTDASASGADSLASSTSSSASGADSSASGAEETAVSSTGLSVDDAPEIEGLTAESAMPLEYATWFNVFYYNDGYKLLAVGDKRNYLIVPEGKDAPETLPDNTFVIKQPLEHIYNAASATMSLFDAIDGMDTVTLSGTDVSGWYIDAPKEAMESGKMVYAGKYSEPDYELLISSDCDLAIESTMILHTPQVQEMLEDLDIPVLVDRSAYETSPLGRVEWVKAYGALLNKEDAANSFFADQKQIVDDLADFQNTGKTVAYFAVNTDGSVVIRTKTDYIPTMISIAGGVYAFADSDAAEGNTSTVSISMEQFYAVAVDADYLIYNATIEESLSGVDDLIAKDGLFADFKAVKDGNVWQIDKKAYQSTDKAAQEITDFHLMLTGGDESQMTFLTKLN